jgi:uncharacterized protein YacL
MNIALAFTRALFMILSVFFMTVYVVSGSTEFSPLDLGLGIGLGIAFGCALIGFDIFFRKFNLRSFNIAIIGLLFGYLMGQALVWILAAILDISSASIHLSPQVLELLQISLFLFGIYTGTLMTLRASDELYVSIPFVRFTPMAQKKKDLLIDSSVLSDARMIDLATSGILDCHLVIPRFLIKDLYAQAEASEESSRAKAKRSLDILKKLEGIVGLEVRYNDTDFPDVKDPSTKMVRLARLLDANIITVDPAQVQLPSIEGIRFINIHDISKALKPLMQTGEHIKIKIQRYGKEPRQGVGYLDDGTMVVVNGGGGFIGETIEVQVLSVKHTSSGRMIFCNALSDEGGYPQYDDDQEP